MPRIVKTYEERRSELLAVAGELFASQGYQATTIDAIIRKTGVAKGTFYYYFKNKQDILEALASESVARIVEQARSVAEAQGISALEKTRRILGNRGPSRIVDSTVMENLHMPENRELHERINVETIQLFAPVLAKVLEQGIDEGVFDVERPLETLQILLAGSLFLLDSGIFPWSRDEVAARQRAMQILVERAMGLEPDSLSFIAHPD
jgi:AcrR family transcriptional regulator